MHGYNARIGMADAHGPSAARHLYLLKIQMGQPRHLESFRHRMSQVHIFGISEMNGSSVKKARRCALYSLQGCVHFAALVNGMNSFSHQFEEHLCLNYPVLGPTSMNASARKYLKSQVIHEFRIRMSI